MTGIPSDLAEKPLHTCRGEEQSARKMIALSLWKRVTCSMLQIKIQSMIDGMEKLEEKNAEYQCPFDQSFLDRLGENSKVHSTGNRS